jgi:hypothetical protein
VTIGGFDISTKQIDCVLVDMDDLVPPAWHRFSLVGRDAWERVRSVPDIVDGRGAWADRGLYAAGVEMPFGPSSGSVALAVGALLTRLPQAILIERWPVNSWRKRLGLKGGGPTAEMKQQSLDASTAILAEEWSGYGEWPQWPVDAHEAHLIALATMRSIETGEEA